MNLDEIRRIREEYESALDVAETKRSAYHHAIRKLYMSGVPLRQIADALGVSHQRVHQIVGEEPPVRRRKRRAAGAAGAAVLVLGAALLWGIFQANHPPRGTGGGDRPTDQVTVRVVAFEGSWRFDYESGGRAISGSNVGTREMVIPAGRPVRLILASRDVIHSFFIPALVFKRDMIPGEFNVGDLRVPDPGTYEGRDGEFAGLYQLPSFTLRALPAKQFDEWLSTAT